MNECFPFRSVGAYILYARGVARHGLGKPKLEATVAPQMNSSQNGDAGSNVFVHKNRTLDYGNDSQDRNVKEAI